MNLYEATQVIVNTAKDEINLSGMHGCKRAYSLLKTLTYACGDDISPEDIHQAYQQVDQEKADTIANLPPVLNELPSKQQQKNVLMWLRQVNEQGHLTYKQRASLEDNIQFLEDYWSTVE